MDKKEVLLTMCANTGAAILVRPEALVAQWPDGREEVKQYSHVEDFFTLPLNGLQRLATEFLAELKEKFTVKP